MAVRTTNDLVLSVRCAYEADEWMGRWYNPQLFTIHNHSENIYNFLFFCSLLFFFHYFIQPMPFDRGGLFSSRSPVDGRGTDCGWDYNCIIKLFAPIKNYNSISLFRIRIINIILQVLTGQFIHLIFWCKSHIYDSSFGWLGCFQPIFSFYLFYFIFYLLRCSFLFFYNVSFIFAFVLFSSLVVLRATN